MRQKLTSKERDNETGLDFFGARYYGSAQGRFTSVDPEGAGAFEEEPQSWNGYAYVLNKPLTLIDPSGLSASSADGGCSAEFSRCDGGESGSQAERDYEQRLQTTIDGRRAQHSINEGDFDRLAAILNGNENVGLSADGEEFWGPLGGLLASAMGGEFGNAFQRGLRSGGRRGGASGGLGTGVEQADHQDHPAELGASLVV